MRPTYNDNDNNHSGGMIDKNHTSMAQIQQQQQQQLYSPCDNSHKPTRKQLQQQAYLLFSWN